MLVKSWIDLTAPVASCYGCDKKRDCVFSPDGTPRAKRCFYFDQRYLCQLRQLLQGILRKDKHQASLAKKKYCITRKPHKTTDTGTELSSCCTEVSARLEGMNRRTVGTKMAAIVENKFWVEVEFNAIARQPEHKAHLLHPHGHCQRPSSEAFFQTDPLNPHFLLLTTEAEGILLDH